MKGTPKTFEGKKVHYKGHDFDEVDLWLIALSKDPVLSPEFYWKDVNNTDYSGCYRVRDYQKKFNRVSGHYEAFACARSVGKTERQKIWAFIHFFCRSNQNLLITAPELLHLLPLTDAIEGWISSVRATRECLKRDRAGKTGFSHTPFGVLYRDGTKIVGRIPNRDGRGVKGQHQPDLMIEEAQDYPDAGWTEVNETVRRDISDFHFHFYGVHRGARGGGFSKRTQGSGMFRMNALTAIMRPGWGPEEKMAAAEAYGGTNAPDYRRNILGEPGSASSPIFVTARLMATVDQDRSSNYNEVEYSKSVLQWEEFHSMYKHPDGSVPLEALTWAIDLPSKSYETTVAGMDIGLTSSPTVMTLFGEKKVAGVDRLALIRRINLHRFPPRFIRELVRAVYAWDRNIVGIGMDATGLGFPLFQDLQDEEVSPEPGMIEKVRGWKFNEKVPVGVDPRTVNEGRDAYGRKVDEEDQVMMTVVEATTRYLREWVDSGYIMLPFDTEITNDLLAENTQRVNTLAQLTGSKKPNAFHILDSMRMAALVMHIEKNEKVMRRNVGPVLDRPMQFN